MYYGMVTNTGVSGMTHYPYSQTLNPAAAAAATGQLLGSGHPTAPAPGLAAAATGLPGTVAGQSAVALAGQPQGAPGAGPAGLGLTSPVIPGKWIMPNFTATQIQYMVSNYLFLFSLLRL